MGLVDRVRSAVGFLRAGHPTGMPGYVPLFALLPRRVSEDEITAIVWQLVANGRRRVDTADVGVEITRITQAMPLPDDVERVRRRLAGAG
ncbi:hypothetical protein A5791_06710 [Mycobacterium sp. 852002-51163_SCH5372311]|uniref:DUF3349 domain-containing protein n=1 Tax=Mycobacterium sp. 852002-51163_SCH5372311 TaxID=1834097 RepID=UPI0007FD032F|nr:DUF3349 domain-containing protein [Mycobacterium sp. 852002-51163_SCH5372311]OBF81317.1 hypothetical protein A5791_06710 [Mycobacterium sp. 852002-51163_SCH5372311]